MFCAESAVWFLPKIINSIFLPDSLITLILNLFEVFDINLLARIACLWFNSFWTGVNTPNSWESERLTL